MDSLLASYGSDDEDGDVSPGLANPALAPAPAPAPSWSRSSIFGSLPPPKNSASEKSSSLWDDEEDEPLKPSSRMRSSNSRSPPGSPSSQHRSNGIAETSKRPGPSVFSALPRPKSDSGTLPSDFFSDSTSAAATITPRVERAIPGGNDDDDNSGSVTGRSSSSSSLFSSLPAPASSKPSFGALPVPSASKAKKVVEFRPPINMALLERTDEDEDESSRKKSKLSTTKNSERLAPTTDSSGGCLFAMLPAPKNSLGAGTALGSGSAHGGRRTVMETGSDFYKTASNGAVNTNSNSGGAHHNSREELELVENKAEPGLSSHEHGFEPSAYSGGSGSYAPGQPDVGYYSSSAAAGSVYDPGSGQQPIQGDSTPSVLAEVMRKERRRGRGEPPTVMMEVKQADLTGGPKLREDQLRATGIAFGPSYQPTASSKDKPSKLHRRKHQLGALYFDMKQNEMNLMERRTKGKLTKAETQAKYGW